MQAHHTETPEAGRRREPPGRGLSWRLAGRKTLAACEGPASAVNRELSRYLFWGLVASLAATVALGVGAQEALAQQQGGGGGDEISQTLESVRNYLAGLAFGVGGIGFVASLLVKAYASINENAHAYAAMGMKGSLWAIIAGAIVTPILTIAQGLAAGGGG